MFGYVIAVAVNECLSADLHSVEAWLPLYPKNYKNKFKSKQKLKMPSGNGPLCCIYKSLNIYIFKKGCYIFLAF